MKAFKNSFSLLLFIICLILLFSILFLWNQNQKIYEDLQNNTNNYYPFSPLSEVELNNYLKKVFHSLDTVETVCYNNDELFLVKDNSELIGYAKLIEKDIPCPTCADLRFICGIDANGMIKKIVLINEIDLRGVKFKIVKLELFLNQLISSFIGKQDIFGITLVDGFFNQFYGKVIGKSSFEIGKNNSVITGATESSYYITQGINEFVKTVSDIH